jgi:hypothetical protein
MKSKTRAGASPLPTGFVLRLPRCAAGRSLVLLVLLALLAIAPGCSVLRAPQAVVNTVVPIGKGNAQPDPLQLQVQIERYADTFIMQLSQSLDDYAKKTGSDAARLEALKLKLLSASAMVSIASGPNPNANLLDLVAVATLSRMSVEDRWMKADKAPAYDQWLATSRVLDSAAWQLATNELNPSYVKELRKSIERWSEENPEALGTFIARPQEFATLMVHEQKAETDRNSVFSIVNLDPTAGLDPAVRELTQTRLMAERAMFTLQRMPFLLRMQTELLTYQLTEQPEVRQALTNVTSLAESANRFSRATESVGQTAAQLPERISTERKAILAALDQQEGKLAELAGNVDRGMESGAKMSTSLNTTLITFDALMKRFGVGEPSTNTAPDTNSPPFNILDYGQVADRIGAMAKEITALVYSVDQSVPQLNRVSQQATLDAQKVVERGFHLGLVLIALLLIGAVLAGLVYRYFAEKIKRAARTPQTSTP